MKDFSSYGYMQGPIRAMIQEDLNKMGVIVNNNTNKRRSKASVNTVQLGDKGQGECGIYGKRLAELETRPVPGQPYIRVPRLLLRSCNFLAHHLETEGLFRKSGSIVRQKAIRTTLNEGNSIDEDANPHDVASLMKQFLRELPEPLLSYELYNSFIQSQMLELEEDRIQSVLLLAICLPDINRHTLQFLVGFLQSVADQSHQNRMTISNLAVVIAPNVIRAASTVSAQEGANIRLETQLMETLIQNSSQLGLVPEDIAHRAHNMLLELSGMWGVSEQEAAYKLPLKGKRKRSGSLSGILTSVFKHNKSLRTTTKQTTVLRPRPSLPRKSLSNQDLSETKMKSVPIHGDLSFSTPCIRTPGPSTRAIISTPLLTAQRRMYETRSLKRRVTLDGRTALLRQTPVDPRRKPTKSSNSTLVQAPSPADMDPPKKRSKLDMSPRTEPVKRKNFKQRLSEGLTSRYRKSRLKRKRSRAHRSSENSAVTAVTTTSTVRDDTPVLGSTTQLGDKKRKEKTPVFCFKAKPGSFNQQQKRLRNSSDLVINNCTNIGSYLDSPVQPELIEYSPTTYVKQLEQEPGSATPGISDGTINKKKLFPSPRVDGFEEDLPSQKQNISPEVLLRRNKSYLHSCHSIEDVREIKEEPTLPRRSPRLRRSAPVTANVQLTDRTTPVLRRSARLSGLTSPQPKQRSVSGDSFTAARHSVSLNVSSITPRTFSRSSATGTRQPFSPIRVSLNCIAPSPSGVSSSAGSRVSSSAGSRVSSSAWSGMSSSDKDHMIWSVSSLRAPSSSTGGMSEGSTLSQSRDLSNSTRSRDSSDTVPDCTANLTDLFTSRDITRLDMSLNVREFDKNFCKQLAQSTEKLAALQQQYFGTKELSTASSNADSVEGIARKPSETAVEVETDDFVTPPSVPGTINETYHDTYNDTSHVTYNDSSHVTYNESHVTYITQNMSSFLPDTTMCQWDADSSRVDFPRFGSLPQLPTAIVLDEKPPLKTPTRGSCVTSLMFSELDISDNIAKNRVSSENDAVSSATSLNSSDANSSASAQTVLFNHSTSKTSITPEGGSPSRKRRGSWISGGESLKSPPKVTRLIRPEVPSTQIDTSRTSVDNTLPSELLTFSQWIGSSTRTPPITPSPEIPETPPQPPENSYSLPETSGSLPETSGSLPENSGDLGSRYAGGLPATPRMLGIAKPARGTPLNYPEQQKTDSKRAIVVQKQATESSVESQHGDSVEEQKTEPVVESADKWREKQVVQDDQITSTVSETEGPVKENTAPQSPTTGPGGIPNTTASDRTPKANRELDTTKINITPRTKISKGFTKNLAIQWETMNSDSKTVTRSTSAYRKTRIPLRVRTTNRSGSASNAHKATAAHPAKSRDSKTGNHSNASVRRGGVARAASVRSVTRPTRAVIRTKSDNSGKSTTPGTRPAWRF